MADPSDRDRKPLNRRGFFVSGFREMMRPVADYLDRKIKDVVPADLPQQPKMLELLRPPGALDEGEFLDTCYRCGKCADACPANAISLFEGEPRLQHGTPFIDADQAACVVCDDLSCMKVCPSGALKLVDRMDIRMGVAVVNDATCLRASDEQCTICVDRCPIGEKAISVTGNHISVTMPDGIGGEGGCVGCGVCQQYCPTDPKSIVIRPTR